jgi:hypothetical protein
MMIRNLLQWGINPWHPKKKRTSIFTPDTATLFFLKENMENIHLPKTTWCDLRIARIGALHKGHAPCASTMRWAHSRHNTCSKQHRSQSCCLKETDRSFKEWVFTWCSLQHTIFLSTMQCNKELLMYIIKSTPDFNTGVQCLGLFICDGCHFFNTKSCGLIWTELRGFICANKNIGKSSYLMSGSQLIIMNYYCIWRYRSKGEEIQNRFIAFKQ